MFSSYNDAHFLFLGTWGPLWLGLFVLLALVVLGLTWLDLRELPRARRATLLGLRAAVLVGGIILVAEPALELREVSKQPNHVAVLVDDSASGQLPADADTLRAEVLRSRVASIQADAAPDRHIFDFYRVGSLLRPASQAELRQLQTTEPSTDLLRAFDDLKERYPEGTLGGVILLSDGSDNATLAARVPRDEALDETSIQQLKRLGVPIHTVPIADSRDLRDVAVARVRHDEFAFVRNAITVEVDLEVHGYESGTVPVALHRDGTLLQTREVTLSPDTKHYSVEFEFVPELIGKEIYSVSITPREDDMVAANNRDFFVLRVIRDKIRVLQVVGKPSWDVRFLRQLLKSDPNVELISFFILRDLSSVHRAPDNEMSLIPFPTHELFHEQLGSFDLIVLQDFPFAPFGMGRYLANIRDYVHRGGGLLMVGGDGSFSAGAYARTPIEEVLPVHLLPSGDASSVMDAEPFRPELTAAGARHPITRLDFDPRANRELWAELPELHGTNYVARTKTGAVALATHPTRRTGGDAMPVIAVGDQQKGRSMALTVDSIWRWNYEHVFEGGSSRPYAAFWNSAIRWLIRDPALNLLQIHIGQNVVAADTMIDVQIQAFLPDYSPAADREIELRVLRRTLDAVLDGQRDETLHHAQLVTTDAQGRARIRLQAEGEAAWRVDATTVIEDDIDAHANEVFLSLEQSQELREIEPRNQLLEAIANATGGTYAAGDQALHRLNFEAPRIERVHRRKSVDLWSSGWVLLVFVGLLALEWQLRRRWGRL